MVKDSNGNKWYEVDYLAQDKVPLETHWSKDVGRSSAYSYLSGDVSSVAEVPTPYSLQYLQTSKNYLIR